ncbi:cellulase family glycosylhydrolase [Chitiniphilus purpureus]|uniref:Cellulase family glycosylhydrolase n=1 Tax=Chitiniphilus purpureus TaxID=2981137 RepID=A0ABY6DJH1_9NEIS|nr:cellulase family glycosylhydrolase [Chitiniphilus sp. CD1]UXY14495.1 cellulase family glycosylhydrolase [Chitiniphilus sp. CD1]
MSQKSSGTTGAARRLAALLAVVGTLVTAPFALAAPAWQEGARYDAGAVVSYNGRDYRALVAHTAFVGANWNPAATPTLWQDAGTATAPTPVATPTPAPGPTPTPTPAPGTSPTPNPTPAPPTPTAAPSVCYATWSATGVYSGGQRVTHNGSNYEARWWTQGDNPAQSGSWGVWKQLGQCGSAPTPTPVPTPTPAVTPTPTPTPTPTAVPTPQPGGSPVARHGQLKVCANNLNLCNEHGEAIQLRGMSSHGLQWYGWGTCLTDASLDTLATDWQADILRISLYVQEGGYESDPAGFTAQVERLIDEATRRGLYALVDWHQLEPGDPNANLALARTFFSRIAQKYGQQKNILYDVANEPNKVPWQRIREYGEQIIPVIRAADPDALVLIGTHGWSSFGVSDGGSVDDILNDPLRLPNIMYTFHFYAASHGAPYLAALKRAAERLPVFVTEWGSQTFSGDGENDFAMTQQYLDYMNARKISWTNWNYSDDWRSGAVWKTGTCASGNWGTTNLKPAGEFVRNAIRTR